MTKKKNKEPKITEVEEVTLTDNECTDSDLDTKTLHNSNVNDAIKNAKDLQVYGNGDTFKLLCKASSKSEGWMKSTKVMPIPLLGCLVQVTTQQRNSDGSYTIAEALTFVPGAKLSLGTPDTDEYNTLIKM